MQTDTRRAAGPGAAAAFLREAAARAAAWVWSVRPIRASSPRPELVYCALRVVIGAPRRRLKRRGRGWARLRSRKIIPCDARHKALSAIWRSRESLVVRNVSLDLFSFLVFGVRHRTWWRDSLNRDRRLRVLHRNASTHSFPGRWLRTVVVRIVPVVSIDFSTSSVASRLRFI